MAYFNGKKVLSVDLKTKVPTAQLEITENGEYNVMQYGSVDVDVPTSGSSPISTPIQVSVVGSLINAITITTAIS